MKPKAITSAIVAAGFTLATTLAVAQTAPPPATPGQDPQMQPGQSQTQPGQSQAQPGQPGQSGSTLTHDQLTELEGMTVTDNQGEEVGDVSRLVESIQDQRPYAVLSLGGFLGMGDSEVAVPLEDLQMVGDELTLTSGQTKEQLEQQAEEFQEDQYREIETGGGSGPMGN